MTDKANTATRFHAVPGKPVTINNPNPCSVIYRVEFLNGDSVEFTVLPGASFAINTATSTVNLHIKNVISAGINPV